MKNIVLYILIIHSFTSFAQIVTETITFDNYTSNVNNDLTNNFQQYSQNIYSQVTIGGITGGAVQLPNSTSWGNDVINYCSTYKNILNSVIETSISFKYNSSLINPNSNQDFPLTIWLVGNGGSNARIGFYIQGNSPSNGSAIGIFIQSTSGIGSAVPLINNHWYKFTTQYKFAGGVFGDENFVKAELFDIGFNGSSTSNSIANCSKTFFDIQTSTSTNFITQTQGSRWGGIEFIDNFIFKGQKFGTNCTNLNITKQLEKDIDFLLYPNPTNDKIYISDFGNFQYEIFDIMGKSILNGNTNENQINVKSLEKGLYILKIFKDGKVTGQKFIKE